MNPATNPSAAPSQASLSPASLSAAAAVAAAAERELAEPFAILAATLCELFQMPCDEMLRHVNAQFAANPLTADFRLHLSPVAGRT